MGSMRGSYEEVKKQLGGLDEQPCGPPSLSQFYGQQQQAALGVLGITGALAGWSGGATTQAGTVTTDNTANYTDAMFLRQMSQPLTPQPKRLKFFRVNEEALESSILEPLDELRIKVAKWLHN